MNKGLLIILILKLFTSIIIAQDTLKYDILLKNLKPHDKNELVLICIHDTVSPYSYNGYKTLIFKYNGNSATYLTTLPYLASPQKNGKFYFIGEYNILKEEECDRNYNEPEDTQENDTLKDASLNINNDKWTSSDKGFIIKESAKSLLDSIDEIKKMNPPINDKLFGNKCNYELEEESYIDYIIPGYFSKTGHINGYTGGAHGGHSTGDNTVEIGSISKVKKANFSDAFTPEQLEKIKRILYFKSVEGRISNGGNYERNDTFNLEKYNNIPIDGIDTAPHPANVAPPLNYILYHKEGRVNLSIQANCMAVSYADSGGENWYVEHDAGAINKKYAYYNPLPMNWNYYKKNIPSLIDMYLSPSENLLFIRLTEVKHIYGREYDFPELLVGINVKTKKMFYVKELYGHIIMSEFATGKHALDWEKTLLNK